MSRARIAKVVASFVALGSLIVVAVAGAAAWQGPTPVSAPGVNAGDVLHPPQISLGASGDATVGWWQPDGVFVARKRAGQGWSAPLSISNPSISASVFPGVDAGGNTTTVWSVAGPQAIISYWPAGDPVAVSHFLPGALQVNDLAVNPSGAAVVAGTVGNDVAVGYRPPGGTFTFDFHTFTAPAGNYAKPRVAINAAGWAVAIWRDNATGLWASVRTATTDWGPVEAVTTSAVTDAADANPSVAIDAAGNIFAAYTYAPAAGIATVRTGLRIPGAGWQQSGDLSSIDPGFTANYPKVVVNASGVALLVWKQTSTGGFANIQARYGSTGTGIWGPIETVNDAGADLPVAAIGTDGTAVAAWERQTMAGNIGQARVRSAGAAGTWGDIHVLSLQHANVTTPSIATDGVGDFAAVSAPFDGSAQRALVSAYDAAAPAISPIAVSGSGLSGDPTTLSVATSDQWSGVAAPVWTFGDGTTGSGLSVSHTYPKSGSYAVHVTVTDGSGNTSGTDVAVIVKDAQATLKSAKFAGKWKVSRVTGTLTVSGTAPRAGTYVVDVTRGKATKIHTSFKLPVGPFSQRIKLPARLIPGSYHVALLPSVAAVSPDALDAKLAAPKSGVVDVATIAGSRNGPPALTLRGANKLWASFHFAALPSGTVTLSWYKLGKKRVFIGSTRKSRAARVVGYLGPAKFSGTYQAVLLRKKVVVARVSVKVRG
jgi:PKD repeat protein